MPEVGTDTIWFNAGAQARIEGRPLTSCPYRDGWEWANWKRGWRFCDRNWGTASKATGNELPDVVYSHDYTRA